MPEAPTAPKPAPAAPKPEQNEPKSHGGGIPTPKPAEKPQGGDPGAPGGDPGKGPAEKKIDAEIRRLKLKINGEERELPEDEVVRLAQRGMGADEKFRESAKMRKQAENFFKLLKTNPAAALAHPAIGLNVRQFAEDIIYKQIQYEKMTDEQKELYEAKLKLKQMEDEKRRLHDEQQTKKQSVLENEYKDTLQKKIVDVLETSGLPKTPRTVARVAHYMFEARARGVRAEPADVIDMVQSDYHKDFQDMFGALPGEAILKIIGDDARKKVREAELHSIKNPTLPVPRDGQPPAVDGPAKPRKILSSDEWRERNRRMLESGE